MALIDEIKEYTHTEALDNTAIQPYIDSAEAYLAGAGVAESEANPVYALAVKMLVAQWYDNRTTKPEDGNSPQARGLDGIILQLQTAGDSSAGG